MYLQCPTDFSLLWHLTKKKKLNGKIFQSMYSFVVDFEWIRLEAAGGWMWAALLQGHFPCTSRRLLFFLFLDVCSIKQLLNLKKKTTPLTHKTSPKKIKKTQNLSCCLLSNNERSEKKNETAAFHFSTQPTQEFPPSEESLNETQKAKI